MTIKQLRYIVAITDNQFNISYTAEKLFTSQPGISKQVKLLEESLGCDIFNRNGKALQGLTHKGEQIVEQARIVLTEYENLQQLAHRHLADRSKSINIATTATQSTYVLPAILRQFHEQYPEFKINIQDGTMDQLIDIANNREADCIILSGVNERLQRKWFPNMLMIPCYEWFLQLICPTDHPLANKTNLTIEDIGETPIVTYPASKLQISAIETVLMEHGFSPKIITTASDPRAIKNYVQSGMGIGIIAPMAYDATIDNKLVAISMEGILAKCTTIIAVERHNLLKPHVYNFIKYFAPHLSSKDIEQAIDNEEDIEPSKTKLPDQIGTWCI